MVLGSRLELNRYFWSLQMALVNHRLSKSFLPNL
jgi:hypothetical protein